MRPRPRAKDLFKSRHDPTSAALPAMLDEERCE
jgi:hypothetical protein